MISKLTYYYETIITKLLWQKYKKRPYIEFYRAVMKHTSKTRLKYSTGGGNWDNSATMQLERLKKYGMRPDHTLFEIGCGQLRGGRYAINYLKKDNYFGNDISPEILNASKAVIKQEQLQDKNPQLYLTKDLKFSEVKGKKFSNN